MEVLDVSSRRLRSCHVALAHRRPCGDSDDGLLDPPARGALVTVEPGAPTVCSRGTPYRFFAMGGDPKRIVIDFEGGGACWNALTCSIEDAIFAAEAPTTEQFTAYASDPALGGIYKEDPANPFADWSLVHVPYCTGDVHWGSATKVYSDTLTIEHQGLKNVEAVLDWVAAHYDPEVVFITGCSAGAYGAIGHAVRIARLFPKAEVRVLADSGAGIITDTFFQQSFPNWQAEAALPLDLPAFAGKNVLDLTIAELYSGVAAAYPKMRIGQYNAAFDRDQTFYYTVMGGGDPWSDKMRQSVETIRAAADNFRYYIAPGPVHCIHPYRIFFDRVSGADDKAYLDWLDDFVNGDTLPDDVACQGEACKSDPVCDACKTSGSEDLVCRWCTEWNAEK